MTTTAQTVDRIPLNTLAIPLGAAGLAELWTGATEALGLPAFIGELFWISVAFVWLWMIAAHTPRGSRSAAALHSQLVHPVQGPIAALVPIVGMLLGANLYAYSPLGGSLLAAVFIITSALYAGWILASWMSGRLELESVHGGYFLPTVAAGYVASYAAAIIGAPAVAIGAFVVASFFWVVMFTLLFARLAFRAPLPDPLMPTLTIMMAPPAVAAAAWFEINGGIIDPVEYALGALAIIMVLIQLALLPRYLRLKFSLGFWSFTFPTANVGALALTWLTLEHPAGWQGITVVILLGVTALVGTIAARSIALWSAGRSTAQRPTRNAAETQLIQADNKVAG